MARQLRAGRDAEREEYNMTESSAKAKTVRITGSSGVNGEGMESVAIIDCSEERKHPRARTVSFVASEKPVMINQVIRLVKRERCRMREVEML